MSRRLALAFPFAVLACTGLGGLSGGEDAGALDGGGESGTEAPPVPPPPPTDGGADADPSVVYRDAVVADGPISYWRFEETSGVPAKDEMGTHDGSYVFAPILGVPGVAGSHAVQFGPKTSAHVDVSTSDFRFAGVVPFTIEAWVMPKAFGNYEFFGTTEIATGSARAGWSVFTDPLGVLSFELLHQVDGSAVQARGLYATSTPLVTARFQHIVVTFNGLALALWIDGVRAVIVDAANPAPDFGDVMTWGCRRNGNVMQECLDDGRLDEVALYDHVLPDMRIALHHQLGL